MKTLSQINPSNLQLTKASRLMELAGDKTRIKIICLMIKNGKMCVSLLSRSLDKSFASVSHHLLLLHEAGMLKRERDGKNICYSLNKNKLVKNLEKYICECVR